MPAVDVRAPAMGGQAHVIVVDGPRHAEQLAVGRLAELERLWSRFLPESDVSRLNRSAGSSVVVDLRTVALVEHAVEAWWATGGRYDPTILPALVDAGYDRAFADLCPDGPPPTRRLASGWSAPGCAGILIEPGTNSVTLPPGTMFDAGGIGKGLAADLIAGELLDAGAAGACVNIGGDLVVAGRPPRDGGWVIGLEDPDGQPAHPWTLALAAGAVATSSPFGKTWRRSGRIEHHLIDPLTGRSAERDLASVTIVVGEGWWAEVLAKAAYLAGTSAAMAMLDALGVAALLIDRVGQSHVTPAMDAVLV